MKKLLTCISLVFVLSAGVTAFAAPAYDSTDNSATTGVDGAKTVMIYKGTAATPTDADIVYVDQADSTFTATTEFFLKDLGTITEDTTYTVKTYNGSSTTSGEFVVQTAEEEDPVESETATYYYQKPMTGEKAETHYEAGFIVNVTGTFTHINVTATNTGVDPNTTNTLSTEISSITDEPTISGDAALTVGIKIKNVPNAYRIDRVWLSDKEV